MFFRPFWFRPIGPAIDSKVLVDSAIYNTPLNGPTELRVVAIDMLFRVASLLGSYNPEKKGQLAKRSVSKKIPKFPAEGGKFWGN